ncbi:hypothetical protein Smp_158790 [Schistosoma mansoni]|uniref:hypothetical protein n=1 Tax=Schistosoma mansoni TaxID=6183 RepID=UPI00019B349D|nr:hypothetical protein Smp_158790 [Schistosoma mansoni]|eukprot:XP_018654034.1 hypothetical protein Smp_158790 [Schistosoma mansoni]
MDARKCRKDCLFKLSLCNQSFVEICKYKELPVVLRALLNSNDDQIKEITFIFIELLVDKFNGDATKLICTSGVIELLFGNISFKNPCFRNVLKCLQRIGTEVELMSSGFVPHGQFLKAISDIMEDCTAQLGILGITCVANIFKELSVPFCSMSFPKEVLLAVITINSSIYNNLSISHLSKRRHLTDVLKRDEFKIWISTLVRGFKYFTSVDFEYLEKYMELSIRGQEFIDISASAISIVCVLINRNIKHIKKLQRSPLVEDGDHEANSLRHCFIFPSKTLKQIIQFPTKAGVNFFLLVSVLITVEFLITYMCLPKFRNVFDNSAIIDEYNKGLDILSLALFDRLQPVHTLVLLRTPRFSTYLENCSPCWIKMAQKIVG